MNLVFSGSFLSSQVYSHPAGMHKQYVTCLRQMSMSGHCKLGQTLSGANKPLSFANEMSLGQHKSAGPAGFSRYWLIITSTGPAGFSRYWLIITRKQAQLALADTGSLLQECRPSWLQQILAHHYKSAGLTGFSRYWLTITRVHAQLASADTGSLLQECRPSWL